MEDYFLNQYNRNMNNFFNFKGTNTLITGGSSGIGEEIAKCLYGLGSNIIIVSRDKKKLDKVFNRINEKNIKRGNSIYIFQTDVTKRKDIIQMSKFVSKTFSGKLNILINSAGTNVRDSIEDIKYEDWDQVININLTGTFLTTQAMLPFLKNSEYGRIINLASIFSSVSYPSRASYSSSKGGVLMFTKTVAIELAKLNITANCISPGPLLTEINKAVLKDKDNYTKFCEKIPLGRFGDPKEVLTSVLFLASKYSTYVTGSDIKVDGGWTAF